MTSPSPLRVARRFLARQGEFVRESDFKYVGIFLDSSEWRKLLQWFRKVSGEDILSDRPRAPHMTIKFNPGPRDIEDVRVGKKARMRVVGWAADEKGQAVEVVPMDGVRPSGKIPHITIANSSGYRASYSNTLLERGKRGDESIRYERKTGPTLRGEIRGFRWDE